MRKEESVGGAREWGGGVNTNILSLFAHVQSGVRERELKREREQELKTQRELKSERESGSQRT